MSVAHRLHAFPFAYTSTIYVFGRFFVGSACIVITITSDLRTASVLCVFVYFHIGKFCCCPLVRFVVFSALWFYVYCTNISCVTRMARILKFEFPDSNDKIENMKKIFIPQKERKQIEIKEQERDRLEEKKTIDNANNL